VATSRPRIASAARFCFTLPLAGNHAGVTGPTQPHVFAVSAAGAPLPAKVAGGAPDTTGQVAVQYDWPLFNALAHAEKVRPRFLSLRHRRQVTTSTSDWRTICVTASPVRLFESMAWRLPIQLTGFTRPQWLLEWRPERTNFLRHRSR
jgi:hypothetical protein